jgi:hypothetical protein
MNRIENFTAGTADQRGPGFVRTFDSASIANANLKSEPHGQMPS